MPLPERLRAVFVSTLELPDEIAVEQLKYRDVEQWDSLGHITLVAAIEDEFGVQLDTAQVIDMSSFKVALDMLRGMGVHD